MALNLLSPTEANLIFGENQSQGQPWMDVIYTIIKKKDPAPDVTKLSLEKELRGHRDEPLLWWGSNEIVSKSSQLMGSGRLQAKSGPSACPRSFYGFLGGGRSSFAPLRLSLCRQFGLGIASFYCYDRAVSHSRGAGTVIALRLLYCLSLPEGGGANLLFLIVMCGIFSPTWAAISLPWLQKTGGCGFLCCFLGDEKSGSRKTNALGREDHCKSSCPAQSLSLQLHPGWWSAANSHSSGVVFLRVAVNTKLANTEPFLQQDVQG